MAKLSVAQKETLKWWTKSTPKYVKLNTHTHFRDPNRFRKQKLLICYVDLLTIVTMIKPMAFKEICFVKLSDKSTLITIHACLVSKTKRLKS